MRRCTLRALAVSALCSTLACAPSISRDVAGASQNHGTLTVKLAARAPVAVEDGLTIELVGVKDDRCPAELRCIWAGQARVTLRVERPGMDPVTVMVEDPASAPTELPHEHGKGAYRLRLIRLEPAASTVRRALSDYTATLQVMKP